MKIFYLINSRIPTEKAEGLEAFKLCQALADKAEVVMVRPRRFNRLKGDPFEFYGVSKNFKIVVLPVLDLVPFNLGHFGFWLEAGTFALASAIYLLLYSRREDVVYSHDQFSIFLPAFFRRRCFYDIHDYPKGKLGFYRRLFRQLAGVTTTNNWKKEKLRQDFSLSSEKIIAWPNGVELDKFAITADKASLRTELGLPSDKFLIGYAGMLTTMSMAKGIDIAIDALKLLPDECCLVLVGGRHEDILHYEGLAKDAGLANRVIFSGWVRHSMMPKYLACFDVLIAPFPKTDHYEYYMSPMKVFEYMAAARPIVASDLNSIREILPEACGLLVKPGSAPDLAAGILKIKDDGQTASIMAQRARKEVEKYAWPERADRIIELMSKI